ncbi:hypothetical protein BDR26DRAFT_952099 [Obelidium mucronatum]|nr:hypothetical protein BDR26DRAFT_952099 [Obelidium mucronatum]
MSDRRLRSDRDYAAEAAKPATKPAIAARLGGKDEKSPAPTQQQPPASAHRPISIVARAQANDAARWGTQSPATRRAPDAAATNTHPHRREEDDDGDDAESNDAEDRHGNPSNTARMLEPASAEGTSQAALPNTTTTIDVDNPPSARSNKRPFEYLFGDDELGTTPNPKRCLLPGLETPKSKLPRLDSPATAPNEAQALKPIPDWFLEDFAELTELTVQTWQEGEFPTDKYRQPDVLDRLKDAISNKHSFFGPSFIKARLIWATCYPYIRLQDTEDARSRAAAAYIRNLKVMQESVYDFNNKYRRAASITNAFGSPYYQHQQHQHQHQQHQHQQHQHQHQHQQHQHQHQQHQHQHYAVPNTTYVMDTANQGILVEKDRVPSFYMQKFLDLIYMGPVRVPTSLQQTNLPATNHCLQGKMGQPPRPA